MERFSAEFAQALPQGERVDSADAARRESTHGPDDACANQASGSSTIGHAVVRPAAAGRPDRYRLRRRRLPGWCPCLGRRCARESAKASFREERSRRERPAEVSESRLALRIVQSMEVAGGVLQQELRAHRRRIGQVRARSSQLHLEAVGGAPSGNGHEVRRDEVDHNGSARRRRLAETCVDERVERKRQRPERRWEG